MRKLIVMLPPLILPRISNWMSTSVLTLALSIVGVAALCIGLINFNILLILVVTLLVAQLVSLFRVLSHIASNKKESKSHLAMNCIAIVLPILLILNVRTIDYAGTYLVVRVIEPHLLSKAEISPVKHSDPNSSFKYFRLSFGQVDATRRWLVYDESDQVVLDYQARNSEWWKVSKESEESEGCASNGRRLFSHFYVQYYGC